MARISTSILWEYINAVAGRKGVCGDEMMAGTRLQGSRFTAGLRRAGSRLLGRQTVIARSLLIRGTDQSRAFAYI